MDTDRLREQIIKLRPWYLDVQVTPEISTAVSLEADTPLERDPSPEHQFHNPRRSFVESITRVYPDGLNGRSVLDCACNCGAYLFWAKELGAGRCVGFDIRQHWIDQAQFLLANRQPPVDRSELQFRLCDLYKLPQQGLDQFDVSIFNGIFYHLPDPMTGLKIAADLARELIIINTSTRIDLPDGMLAVSTEPTGSRISGVHGLNWYPTGPEVLSQILNWTGFPHSRVIWWRKGTTESRPAQHGRVVMIAARNEETLAAFDQ